ncbi:hypothetical protein DAEQUDRAFT_539272 [Daedalea quercina L-15889]|uniref:Uncharacterized protein n=1 Tax=Daedalea quercina L-15889 TaxID=1314783 RepID=A0A165M325_9APHY|nr:hypothetical protein DAEQUDRAFT_539272 [Daedalea quercina L-15889]
MASQPIRVCTSVPACRILAALRLSTEQAVVLPWYLAVVCLLAANHTDYQRRTHLHCLALATGGSLRNWCNCCVADLVKF